MRERFAITAFAEIERPRREYCKQLCAGKLMDTVGRFLGRCKLLKFTEEQIESPNTPITNKDTELVILPSSHCWLSPRWISWQSAVHLKKNVEQFFTNLKNKNTRREHFPIHLTRPFLIILILKLDKCIIKQVKYRPVTGMNVDPKHLTKY